MTSTLGYTNTSTEDIDLLSPTATVISASPETESSKNVVEITLKSITVLVILILSVFLNILVPLTLYRKAHLMTSSNRYVFFVTVPNCVFSILVLPFMFISVISRDWIFGIVWCNFTGFLTLATLSGSMLMLAVIALDRYFAIVRPMLYPLAITNTRTVPLIIVVWILAIIFSLPPAFGWSSYAFNAHKATCLPVWNKHISYTVVLLALCYLTPFVVIVVCYSQVLQVARTKARKVNMGNMILESPRRHSTGGALDNRRISFSEADFPSEPPNSVTNHQRRHSDSSAIDAVSKSYRTRRRSRSSFSMNLKVNSPTKALKTISLLIGMQLLTLGPLMLCICYETIHGTESVPGWILSTVTWLAFTTVFCYPCMYGLWNKTLRTEAYKMLCQKSRMLDDEELLFLHSRRASMTHSISDSINDLTKMQVALLQFRANRSNSLISSATGATSSDSGTVLTCIDETDVEEGEVGTPSGIKTENTERSSHIVEAPVVVHTANRETKEVGEDSKTTVKESSDEGVQSLDDETDASR
ncbi:G-protein coupled receptor 161-like [Ptychodera flava]|uniref:G-protein coupled receptor 161-like n=1 Tax=Ptychodera flava TaxID=63121 RepID=UPI003969E5EA